jgi:hypothetical protein
MGRGLDSQPGPVLDRSCTVIWRNACPNPRCLPLSAGLVTMRLVRGNWHHLLYGRSLKSNSQPHPNAIHFVIGHSHGGNVALKAVEMGNLSHSVNVICLSTPFFHVRARFIGLDHEIEQVGVGALGIVIGLPYFLQLRFLIRHPYAYVVVGVLLLGLSVGVWKLWTKAAHQFRSQTETRVEPSTSLMIVRSVGDEAAAFIGAFQILSWMLTRAGLFYLSIILNLVRFIEAMKKWRRELFDKWWMVTLVCSLFVFDFVSHLILKRFVLLNALERLTLSSGVTKLSYRIEALAPILPYILLVITLPLILIALGIMLSGLLPLGFQAVLGLPFYEVTVEPVPSGKWTVYQIAPQGRVIGLMHSLSYENPLALAVIAEWVNGKMSAPFLVGLS